MKWIEGMLLLLLWLSLNEKGILYSDSVKRGRQTATNAQRRPTNSPLVGRRGTGKTVGQQGIGGSRLTGVRKEGVSSFKAVKRTVDVFIGRVDKDVNEDVIKDYIKDTFNISCMNVVKLQIKTDLYNAFKVTVALSERENLFNSDLWPEDVVINKFYNRNKGTLNKDNLNS